jgi:ATP-dependent helicase/nuclease subunit A
MGVMEQRDFTVGGHSGAGFVMGREPDVAASSALAPAEALPALPSWATTPAPPEPTPARPLAPSRPSPMAPALRSPLRDRATAERRFRRGTLLHRLLQFLPGVAAADREAVAARLLADAELPAAELAAHVATVARVLDDPAFAGVAEPVSRLRIEILKQAIDRLRGRVAADLGPALGVAAGFNALDGD